jgi:hypothetical protein
MWHRALVTATEYDNFFELRCPKYEITFAPLRQTKWFRSKKDLLANFKNLNFIGDPKHDPRNFTELDWLKINKGQADIHMMALAEAMWDAKNESTPKLLKGGEWHIPFGDNMDMDRIRDISGINLGGIEEDIIKMSNGKLNSKHFDNDTKAHQPIKVKIATARAARVSYINFEGKDDYEADLKLHDRNLALKHASIFEHCAPAMHPWERERWLKGKQKTRTHSDHSREFGDYNVITEDMKGWCRNFRGFIQYREILGI